MPQWPWLFLLSENALCLRVNSRFVYFLSSLRARNGKNINLPAPKYHTKGCSRSSVDSPGAQTLVFAAFEPLSSHEFWASIARTPFVRHFGALPINLHKKWGFRRFQKVHQKVRKTALSAHFLHTFYTKSAVLRTFWRSFWNRRKPTFCAD